MIHVPLPDDSELSDEIRATLASVPPFQRVPNGCQHAGELPRVDGAGVVDTPALRSSIEEAGDRGAAGGACHEVPVPSGRSTSDWAEPRVTEAEIEAVQAEGRWRRARRGEQHALPCRWRDCARRAAERRALGGRSRATGSQQACEPDPLLQLLQHAEPLSWSRRVFRSGKPDLVNRRRRANREGRAVTFVHAPFSAVTGQPHRSSARDTSDRANVHRRPTRRALPWQSAPVARLRTAGCSLVDRQLACTWCSGTLSALPVAFAFGGCLLALLVYLGSRLRNSVESIRIT